MAGHEGDGKTNDDGDGYDDDADVVTRQARS